MERVNSILNFWFGDPTAPDSEYGQQRQVWFKKDPEFDEAIRRQFLPDYEQAAKGELNLWCEQPHSCLALVLLLDQFPRNLFRGSAQSFATDAQALVTAQYGLGRGYDQELIPVERVFLYLPFEHSEKLEDQERAVALCAALSEEYPDFESTLNYAIQHRDIIQQFGRFPHRNQLLQRETTPEEAAFLKQPGSRF